MSDTHLCVRVVTDDEDVLSDPVEYNNVQIINDENSGTLVVVFYRNQNDRSKPTSKWIFAPDKWESVCMLTPKEMAR